MNETMQQIVEMLPQDAFFGLDAETFVRLLEAGWVPPRKSELEEPLKAISALTRVPQIGKLASRNSAHLRRMIEKLDAAGLSDAADTITWGVWHRVNAEAWRYHSQRETMAVELAVAETLTRVSEEVPEGVAVTKRFRELYAERLADLRDALTRYGRTEKQESVA